MQVIHDVWLSEVFGYDVFKVTLCDKDDFEKVRSVVSDLLFRSSQSQSVFYYAKVSTERVEQVGALTAAGFKVVDVNVIFDRSATPLTQHRVSNSIQVCDILPEHHEAILDIAESCFVYSRFHLDPKISNEVANVIKREWINGYIQQKRGERLLVGVLDNKPVGFLAVLETTSDGKLGKVIDLIGVDKPYQKRGCGKSLVEYFVSDYAKKCDFFRVGTQVANVPSMRLYEGCGFYVTRTEYVLHAHLKKGRVLE